MIGHEPLELRAGLPAAATGVVQESLLLRQIAMVSASTANCAIIASLLDEPSARRSVVGLTQFASNELPRATAGSASHGGRCGTEPCCNGAMSFFGIPTVSRRLGHGSPTVTLTAHGHLVEKTDAKGAAAMDAASTKGA
ncbi:MAG: hypothetical protein KGJ78_16880 [Alphaproteobacteria bacterium]|nr:hypothetical protein [Alphaproteobacteria bacterium]